MPKEAAITTRLLRQIKPDPEAEEANLSTLLRSTKPEHGDEKPKPKVQQRLRKRAGNAPSPSVEPKAKVPRRRAVKKEEEEIEYKPEPEHPDVHSLLDMPFLRSRYGPTVDVPAELLQERHFKRKDLGGPPVEMCSGPRATPARPVATRRLAIDARSNYGCTQPGDPFFCFTYASNHRYHMGRSGEPKMPVTVYVKSSQSAAKRLDYLHGHADYDAENWRLYGTYEVQYYGPMTTDDFIRAGSESQETLIDIIVHYTGSARGKRTLEGWGFSKDPFTPNGAVRRQSIRRDFEERAHELKMSWGLYQYVGSADAVEWEYIRQERAKRRA